MASSALKPIAVLFCSSILWGAAWLPLKALHHSGADGISLIFVSYSLLWLGSLVWAWPYRALVARHWPFLLGITLLGGAANLCFTYAMMYGDVIRAMVLFYLLPVWGVLGGRFILKEATSAWRWLGVALAVIGAFILIGGPKALREPPAWVDVIALASGFFFAASNLLFRGVEAVPLAPKLSALFGGAALLGGVTLGLMGTALPWQQAQFPWGWVALYSLSWLLLANVGSQWAVTQMPAGRSSIIIIMELVTAVLTATLIGQETLTPAIVVGGLLIISATGLELWAGSTPTQPKGQASPL